MFDNNNIEKKKTLKNKSILIANNTFVFNLILNVLFEVIDLMSSGSLFHKLQPLLAIDFLPTVNCMLIRCQSHFLLVS